jgi:hypothetical protein
MFLPKNVLELNAMFQNELTVKGLFLLKNFFGPIFAL